MYNLYVNTYMYVHQHVPVCHTSTREYRYMYGNRVVRVGSRLFVQSATTGSFGWSPIAKK